MKLKKLAIAMAAAFSLSQAALALPAPSSVIASHSDFLPSANDWLEHAGYLKKFWLQPAAYGTPHGNFPTWRCNDGSLPEGALCQGDGKSPKTADEGFKKIMMRQYVRMMSRQTFAYGALYNLTGDKEALRMHLAGTDYLIKNAMDPNGGFFSFFENGKGMPEPEQRTSQDLAYALVGLAMNAYLTHDPRTIEAIAKTQQYIFDRYYDPKSKMLRWVLSDFENERSAQKELVAQLDQLNGYMMLTWRLMPPEIQKKWTKDIKILLKTIDSDFAVKNSPKFMGCLDMPECGTAPKGKHSDYGHSIKALWMKNIAAMGLRDAGAQKDSMKKISELISEALAPTGENWFENTDKRSASWWVWAELDQAMLHSALFSGTSVTGTLKTWMRDMTDKEFGEMKFGRKQHLWRNGYHSTEHALLGYILSQAIRAGDCENDAECLKENSVTLHYAIKDFDNNPFEKLKNVTPYLYGGEISGSISKHGMQTVTFRKIHAPVGIK